MAAMPPTTAAPLLRSFRRVTVVMHSSCGNALRPSDAGLESLSVERASVIQRMRAFSRAQRVVSTIICWCSHAGTGMAISARNRLNSSPSSGAIYGDAIGGLYGIGALQPGYEAYRHTGLLHAAMVAMMLRRRASFPRLI